MEFVNLGAKEVSPHWTTSMHSGNDGRLVRARARSAESVAWTGYD